MNSSRVCMKLRDFCDSHKTCLSCDFEHFCTYEGYNTEGKKLGDFMNDAYMQLKNLKRGE